MKCIICYKDTNSNTQMSVAVEGVQYNVPLCEEHAESTTVGQIRAKVSDILVKIREMVSMAQAIGIDIRPMLVDQPKQVAAPDPAVGTQPQSPAAPTATMVVNKKPLKPIVAGDKMPKIEEVHSVMRVNEVAGIAGIPLQIQTHEEGACGTTDISVVRVSDDVIQRRFKSLNDIQSKEGKYALAPDCLACRGSGTHPITKQTCPKCNGTGSLQQS